jgi:hypothetical protein
VPERRNSAGRAAARNRVRTAVISPATGVVISSATEVELAPLVGVLSSDLEIR